MSFHNGAAAVLPDSHAERGSGSGDALRPVGYEGGTQSVPPSCPRRAWAPEPTHVAAWMLLGFFGAFGMTSAADAPEGPQTVVYKTVGETKIEADVYGADDKVRPAVVWIHGGALGMGSRKGVPPQLVELCRREGYVLVSLDYRLGPEVKLPEIAADVRDALQWLHTEGKKRLHVDPERIAVTGGSAGGYLTLLSGTFAGLRPRALVAYWGYGDVDGDWYTRP